jgi:hypothetical protein
MAKGQPAPFTKQFALHIHPGHRIQKNAGVTPLLGASEMGNPNGTVARSGIALEELHESLGL